MAEFNIEDICKKALYQGYYLSKFLDFKEQSFINSINKSNNNQTLCVKFSGGYSQAERSRAIVYNKNEFLDQSLFNISILHSTLPKKHGVITHRHVLGTIMSLGIERNTFGDIVIKDEEIFLFCSTEIKDFLISNLTNINNTSITFEEVDEFINDENELRPEERINIPSLRLDAILAKSMNKSRNDACEIIKTGNVLINYDECLDVDKQIRLGDLISIRHFGRIKVIDIVGVTKKNRLNVLVEIKH